MKPQTGRLPDFEASPMDSFIGPSMSGSSTRTRFGAQASWWPTISALGVVVLSAALVPFAGTLFVGVSGYVLAAVLAPAFVVVYRALDRRAQQDVYYTRRQAPRRVAALAIVLGLVIGATHAWLIATEIAKR